MKHILKRTDGTIITESLETETFTDFIERLIQEGVSLDMVNLAWKNLSWTNLEGVSLIGANLTGVNLIGAILNKANLTYANLNNANLAEAVLSGANLTGVIIKDCIGNGKEIKTLQTEFYSITYTKDRIAIDNEQHVIKYWYSFDDTRIMMMGSKFLEFWKKWKPILESIGIFDEVKNLTTNN